MRHKIFLIEDDEEDRELFQNALAEVGTEVNLVAVNNGKDAISYLMDENKYLPDYIFLDLRMPGISGKQCLIELKKIHRLSGIPVIVYTTSRNLLEAQELKILGAAHFMSKPTSPQEIYYLISVVLEDKFI